MPHSGTMSYKLQITRPGSTLLTAIIFLVIISFLVILGFDRATNTIRTVSRRVNDQEALRIGEAGIEKAVWCLNNPSNTTDCPRTGGNYLGESDVVFGRGHFTTTVTGNSSTRSVTASATVAGSGGSSTKILTVDLTGGGVGVAFHYGVQVGQGGLEMDNGSYIAGDVYSNGSIIGQSILAEIRGTAIVAGGTALAPDQQQNIQTTNFNIGTPANQADAAQSFRAGDSNFLNKISLYIKKVSTPGDANVRVVTDNGGSPSTTQLTSGVLNADLVTSNYGWVDVTFTSSPALVNGTTYWIVLDYSSNNTRYYVWGEHDNSGYGNGIGMFCGNYSSCAWNDAGGDFGFKTWLGGITTKIKTIKIPNTVIGATAHANTLEGVNVKASSQCAVMTGSTVSGNVTCGSVGNSNITGNVTAETVTDSTVSGNLTCETQSGNTISGTVNCPTPVTPPADAPPELFPISDGNISDWQDAANVGGVTPGDYVVNTDVSLGPKEITGDLSFGANDKTLTITGTVYVHGTISVSNGSEIRCATTYGTDSCVILSDEAIDLSNNATFAGSGTSGSFVMLLTTSPCLGIAQPDCAPNNTAIYIANNANGAVFFSSRGMIYLKNGVSLTEATGFKLKLENNASVNYEQGLINTNFTSGPGGGWLYKKGTYRVVEQ